MEPRFPATSSESFPIIRGTTAQTATSSEPSGKRKRNNEERVSAEILSSSQRDSFQANSNRTELRDLNATLLTSDHSFDIEKAHETFAQTLNAIGSELNLTNAANHYKVARSIGKQEEMASIERFCLENLSLKNFHYCAALLPASENYRSQLYNFLCKHNEFAKIAGCSPECLSKGAKAGILFLKEHSSNLVCESEYILEADIRESFPAIRKEIQLLFSNKGLKKLTIEMAWEDTRWYTDGACEEILNIFREQSNLEELTLMYFSFDDEFTALQILNELPLLKSLGIYECGVTECYSEPPRSLSLGEKEEIKKRFPFADIV